MDTKIKVSKKDIANGEIFHLSQSIYEYLRTILDKGLKEKEEFVKVRKGKNEKFTRYRILVEKVD